MASYDAVTIKGKKWLCLKNEKTVGVGGKNKTGDVMLIQAMLRYILPRELFYRYNPPIPEVNGIFDGVTREAIWFFQDNYRDRLISGDKIIHPPSYEGRDLKNLNNPLMTITLLHLICKDTAKRFHFHGRYAEGITLLYPRLLPFLKYPGMKTLPFVA